MTVGVDIDGSWAAFRPDLLQRLNRKPKANRSTDSNSLEAISRPNLQYELLFQKYMEQFEITLDRNPQSVVAVLVSSQPARKDSLEVNKAMTAADQQTGGPSWKRFTIHKDFLCFYSPFFALHSMAHTKKERHKP